MCVAGMADPIMGATDARYVDLWPPIWAKGRVSARTKSSTRPAVSTSVEHATDCFDIRILDAIAELER